MIATFTINQRLPGLNEIISATNRNRYIGNKVKRQNTDLCAWAIREKGIQPITTPVKVKFYWIERDLRRDPDNICSGAKFIMDALVETGTIPNDSRKWIKGIWHNFPLPDPKNPRVIVEIFPETFTEF